MKFEKKMVLDEEGEEQLIRVMTPSQVREREEMNQTNTSEAIHRRVLEHAGGDISPPTSLNGSQGPASNA